VGFLLTMLLLLPPRKSLGRSHSALYNVRVEDPGAPISTYDVLF
jgi:hypothetical protein